MRRRTSVEEGVVRIKHLYIQCMNNFIWPFLTESSKAGQGFKVKVKLGKTFLEGFKELSDSLV